MKSFYWNFHKYEATVEKALQCNVTATVSDKESVYSKTSVDGLRGSSGSVSYSRYLRATLFRTQVKFSTQKVPKRKLDVHKAHSEQAVTSKQPYIEHSAVTESRNYQFNNRYQIVIYWEIDTVDLTWVSCFPSCSKQSFVNVGAHQKQEKS